MKINKVLSFLFIGVTTAMVMAGCGEDEPIAPGASSPTITITTPSATGATAVVGGSVDFEVTMKSNTTSNSEIESFKVSRTVAGTTVVLEEELKINLKEYTVISFYEVGTVAGDAIFTFTAVDKKGQSATATYSVKVGGAIVNRSVTLLGNQASASNSFYDAVLGIPLSQGDAFANQVSADIVYYYGNENGNTNKATLAAPFSSGAGQIYNNTTTGLQKWGKRNATFFKEVTLTKTEFDAITNDIAIIAAVTGATANDAKNLVINKAFAFKTENTTIRPSKSGILFITSIVGTNGSDGSISFVVKIQQ